MICIKITSLLVDGPVSTLEDEGLFNLLKRHGSIARVIPVSNMESKYHDHTIVEYNFGSAIELISPFLPLSYTSKENPSLTYQIRTLSSVYSCEESTDATTSYLSTLKNIAKLTGKSFNALLQEELSQISSSWTPDDVDEDEAALVELSSTEEQNVSKTNVQSPGSVWNVLALYHDDLPRSDKWFSGTMSHGKKASSYLQRLKVALSKTVKEGGIKSSESNHQLLRQFCRGCWDYVLISELHFDAHGDNPIEF